MRKTLVIALREYLAAVRTKSFVISLILLPIMMGSGLIAAKLGQKLGDTSLRYVAIVDRSPGATLFTAIADQVHQHNTKAVFDETGRQARSKFELENVPAPDPKDSAAFDRLRLDLSKRIRAGQLMAYVEIGPNVFQPATRPSGDDNADDASIRYTSNRPTYRDFVGILQSALPPAVARHRLEAIGVSYETVKPQLTPPSVVDRGLAEEHEGKVSFEARPGQFAPFIIPLALLMLMFIVVIVGASPMTANVIEEKQLRIAEVLLGSVRPFELMMGKLLGGVAVALTLAAIYFGGAYYVAFTQGMAGYISGETIAWFIFFTMLGTMMYGSMFVAAGSAVTNIKEAQTMVMPVMLMIVMPMSLIGPMIQDPSGPLALIASFFPFSAPMVMTARMAIPPGVPIWEKFLSAAIVMSTTLAIVWAAGRIFRVGLLMQGQGATAQLVKWIWRG